MDTFLFNPNSSSRCASELKVIESLMQCGKEKFLIHPLIEVFMKLKWHKTWFLYMIYMVLFGVFFITLTGYTLTHYGTIFEDVDPPKYGTDRSNWW